MVKVAETFNLYRRKINYQLDTEIKTGDTWIDGKDIYLKVGKGILPKALGSWKIVFNLDVSNLDMIIRYEIMSVATNSNFFYHSYNDNTSYLHVLAGNNGNIQAKHSHSELSNLQCYVFAYYTKK